MAPLKIAIFMQILRQKNARNTHLRIANSVFCAFSSLSLQKSYFFQGSH